MTSGRKQLSIIPADVYEASNDLWVVSAYFDSEGYASKLKAFQSYISVMEASGIQMLLVEGAFGKRPFLLPKSDRILHVRCPSVMWQKERLLNVAIEHLPNSCRKVAWLDTDIFFENPRWAVETANLLDDFPIVQPFDLALWLPKGAKQFRGRGIAWSGFASVAYNHPGLYLSGDFDRHGHSGYAWAARKDLILKHGLYDRSIAGSGDHLMAHGMMGDLSSPCVTNSVGAATPFRDSFHSWAMSFNQDVRSRVGFTRGAVLHRWHGDRKKRNYYKRMVGLLARSYNPSLDVQIAPSGAFQWTEHGAALGRWMRDYFTRRQEDGMPGPVESVPWDRLNDLRRDAPGQLDDAIRPFAALLGPFATLVAEQSEEWTGLGLTPVLPNLVASMILRSPISYVRQEHNNLRDSFEMAKLVLEETLRAGKRFEETTASRWEEITPVGRWAALSGVSERRFAPLSEQLKMRIRDPRWNDAPELRTATRQLLDRRARLALRKSSKCNPYDAVVGYGSAVVGLDHV
ncbi:MAG: hypothetical protein M1151_02190 [Candidatus Thermoplasmatota archaeon]|jgi:hypothetical protein|nr:hypothetical protein [Candidatus Thermoplasmatota archaeon]MCL5785465.1 hypothetical protein [Candidatus Thermoplasmatota archaeon]